MLCMLFELLLALLLGVIAGVITGLIPGIHINLVSLLLVSISGYFLGFVHPLSLGVFIVAMAVTHTFLDIIPSVFLGAPDADTALAVLPGHKLLLEGRGYEAIKLATIGSLLCLLATIMVIPFLLPFLPAVYGFLQPYIGWILLAVVIFMILKESGLRGKFWGVVVFFAYRYTGYSCFEFSRFRTTFISSFIWFVWGELAYNFTYSKSKDSSTKDY